MKKMIGLSLVKCDPAPPTKSALDLPKLHAEPYKQLKEPKKSATGEGGGDLGLSI